jgi:hypothetical protein
MAMRWSGWAWRATMPIEINSSSNPLHIPWTKAVSSDRSVPYGRKNHGPWQQKSPYEPQLLVQMLVLEIIYELLAHDFNQIDGRYGSLAWWLQPESD